MIRTYGTGERPSDTKHDLVNYISQVYDQGSLNNCTVNALCSAYGLELMRQSMESNNVYEYFDSSRLFLYYNSRLYDGTTDQNTGVSVRHIFKAMKKYGLCTEASWPYDEQIFSWRLYPPAIKKDLEIQSPTMHVLIKILTSSELV